MNSIVASGQSKKVRIIGAGFSGLSLAYYLVKLGFEIEIFEKSERVGGLIGTIAVSNSAQSSLITKDSHQSAASVSVQEFEQPTMRVETAANAFLWTEDLADMCEDIGCSLEKALPAAKRRYIFWKKKVRWPLNFIESLVLLAFVFRLIFAKKSLMPKESESISEWGTRNLGRAHVEKLIAPALQGIYAGDPVRMSATLILKILFSKSSRDSRSQTGRKRQFGSHSPKLGMQEFVDKLEKHLLSNGVKIHKNTSLQISELQENFTGKIVIATNPKQMTELIRPQYPEVADCFSKIEMLNLARVTVGIAKPQATLDGFGVLFTKRSGFRVLGVLSNSESFASRGLYHNESWIFGGANDSNFLNQSDSEITKLISEERARLLSAQDSLDQVKVIRWSEALVHYDLNLESALSRFKQFEPILNSKGLWFTGNYLGSIGLSRMLNFNKDLAERMGK